MALISWVASVGLCNLKIRDKKLNEAGGRAHFSSTRLLSAAVHSKSQYEPLPVTWRPKVELRLPSNWWNISQRLYPFLCINWEEVHTYCCRPFPFGVYRYLLLCPPPITTHIVHVVCTPTYPLSGPPNTTTTPRKDAIVPSAKFFQIVICETFNTVLVVKVIVDYFNSFSPATSDHSVFPLNCCTSPLCLCFLYDLHKTRCKYSPPPV